MKKDEKNENEEKSRSDKAVLTKSEGMDSAKSVEEKVRNDSPPFVNVRRFLGLIFEIWRFLVSQLM